MKANEFAQLSPSQQEGEINRKLSISIRMQMWIAALMGIAVLIQTISLMVRLGFLR